MADAQARIVISARDDTAAALAKAKAGFAGLQGSIGAVGASFASLQTGLVSVLAGAGVGAFAAFARSVVNGLDALNDLKDATGSSIENISALEDVAIRTGSSFETVSQSLIKFNKALSESKPGSDIELALKSIGLSALELKELDPAEALLKTAMALSNYENNAKKARLTQEFFGKSLREVAPFLKDLAEQGELVAKVSTKQAQEAEKFNNQLNALSKSATDAARSIASDLIPQANELISRFIKSKEAGTLLIDTLLNLGKVPLPFPLSGAGLAIPELASSSELARLEQKRIGLENIAKTDRELGRQENANNTRALQNINKQIAALKQLEIARQGFEQTASSFGGQKLPDAPDITEKAKQAKQVQSEFDKYIDKLIEAQIATLNLSAEEQARYDIAIGKLGKLNKLQQEQVIITARGLDLLKNQKPFGPDIPLSELERRNDAARDVANMIANTAQGQINSLTRQYGNLDEALRDGSITSQQYVDALDLLDQRFAELQPSIQSASDQISEFSKRAAEDIKYAVGDSVLAALEGNFDSILDIWVRLLERMVAEAIAAELNEALFGGLFGGGGSGSGLIGDAVKLFGGFFADGGYLQPGKIGVVGQAGPELIMAGSRGATITPNGGGGTVNVTYNIQQVGSGVSRGEVIAGLSTVRDSTRAELLQIMARKGLA